MSVEPNDTDPGGQVDKIPTMEPIHTAQAPDPDEQIQVMEIDPSAPEEEQAKERAMAQMAGIPVVMKGAVKEGAKPADKTGAKADVTDADDDDGRTGIGSRQHVRVQLRVHGSR